MVGGPRFIVHGCVGSLGSCACPVSGRRLYHRSELSWESGSTWGSMMEEERETGFSGGHGGAPSSWGGWRVEASHLDPPVRPFHENVPPCAHPAGLPAAGLHLPNPQDSRGTSLETGGCPLSGLGCLELTSGGDMPAACSLSQSPSCNLSYSPSQAGPLCVFCFLLGPGRRF